MNGRRRASANLHALGQDRRAGPLRRKAARLLSLYERASLCLALSSEAIGPLDAGLVMLARRAVLHGTARSAGTLSEPPTSGWQGNMLFMGVWALLIAMIATLFE